MDKTLILQQRIKELRLKSNFTQKSYVPIDTRAGKLLETRATSDLDKRIIKGYMFVWGVKDMHGTKMLKGCCAKSIKERGPSSNAKYKLTFLWQHDQTDPLAQFAVLEEDDYGLYFETKPLDDVANADRTITQIRSGTLNQFSGGFDYVWDKMEYDETDDSIVCKEIDWWEGSVVTIASQGETFAIRSLEGIQNLFLATEDFILTLPRKYQLEARQLFSRHKSLLNLEPFTEKETLDEQEPMNEDNFWNLFLKNF